VCGVLEVLIFGIERRLWRLSGWNGVSRVVKYGLGWEIRVEREAWVLVGLREKDDRKCKWQKLLRL